MVAGDQLAGSDRRASVVMAELGRRLDRLIVRAGRRGGQARAERARPAAAIAAPGVPVRVRAPRRVTDRLPWLAAEIDGTADDVLLRCTTTPLSNNLTRRT